MWRSLAQLTLGVAVAGLLGARAAGDGVAGRIGGPPPDPRPADRQAGAVGAAATTAPPVQRTRWWKGNLHTHTLWSDGDQYPEMVLDWYQQAGYDFVALSDHNTVGDAERWIDVVRSRGGIAAYQAYLDRFGADWVRSRQRDGTLEAMLTPTDECRRLLESPGRFLVLQGEEISATVRDRGGEVPVHVNATNLRLPIAPLTGASARDVAQRTVDAVLEQRRASGQPMFPHLPHPNYGGAFSGDDLAAIRGNRFIEVYNGHPYAWNAGDATRAPVETLWDQALTQRLLRGDPPLYGLAVDDAHDYGSVDARRANPGRGWVMVRATTLDAASLIDALERGDFYASTGVTLSALRAGRRRIALAIRGEPGVTYTTRFIGTRRPSASPDATAPVGEVLKEVSGLAAAYHMRGDELYVRAVVTASRRMDNAPGGESARAWIQPVQPR